MQTFFEQYQANVSPGPHHVSRDALPAEPPADPAVRYLAYYLPQFHEVAENNLWWGQKFTEWTNVTKALPRYDGHMQPRLPGELGFYDLAQVDALHAQAALAKRGGIAGFCIHDYWFSGRKILEKPINLILANKDIDLRFCLNWANENWSRRWDGSENDILLEQRYDPQDLNGYVRSILPALADDRYIRVGGRPLIMVYRTNIIPEARRMFDSWREFLVKEGIGDPYLVAAQTFGHKDPRPLGMDADAGFPPHGPQLWDVNDRDFRTLFDLGFVGQVRSYSFLAKDMLGRFSDDFTTFPGVCPGWDNEARKPRQGLSFYGATPELYASWLRGASQQVMAGNAPDERIVFINAWNEWAEGAILEPDRHFGHAFLAATRSVLDQLATNRGSPASIVQDITARSTSARTMNGIRRKMASARQKIGG